MTRGTFANIRLKNQMIPGVEGGFTRYLPTGEQMSIFEAAKRYQEAGIPLLVLAGKEYGTGSSRDWAAKGVLLLGVKVVLAESFERIHRSNLVCMGILPLQFKPGQSAAYYGLTGNELFEVENFTGEMQPRAEVNVYVQRENGQRFSFLAIARIDTPIEVEYYQNGGLLPAIYRKITSASS
jgi:aconitate hydratase